MDRKAKLTNKLLARFNAPDTALVISGWPTYAKAPVGKPTKSSAGKPAKAKKAGFGKQASNHGIAWYTKDTVEPVAKKYGKRFVVLAEKNGDNRPFVTADGQVLVLRVFDKKRTSLYPQILTWLRTFSQIKHVYVHSEFGMKGGMSHFALLIPFLALVRLFGKQVVFFSHNVVDNVGMLAGHLNLEDKPWVVKLLNVALRMYYQALALLCRQIVVLDESLRERLVRFVSENKVTVLPMAVGQKPKGMSKTDAKKKLGLKGNHKVLLFFGFVSWYKGADWLIETFDAVSQKKDLGPVRLVVAGGPSYSLAGKEYYQEYYSKLEAIAARNPRITLTGFVPEKDIARHFAAADLVALPYRGLMGASGCMTQALSYGKPVVFSREMQALMNNEDIGRAAKEAGVSRAELSFGFSKRSMERLVSVVQDRVLVKKLGRFSKGLAELRSREGLLEREYTVLYRDLVRENESVWERVKRGVGRLPLTLRARARRVAYAVVGQN